MAIIVTLLFLMLGIAFPPLFIVYAMCIVYAVIVQVEIQQSN